jgi:hypothetical protein
MTCDRIKELLPLAASGDLAGEELLPVQRHCDACPACRAELRALQMTLRALTEADPKVGARVEVADIYRAEAARQAKSIRRWRWSALSFAAAAALLLGLFGLTRLELRLDGRQLVVRWGATPESSQKPQHDLVASGPPAVTPTEDAATRVARLEELVLALAQNARGLDTQLTQQQRLTEDALNQLATQLEELRQEMKQDRAGIYALLNANTSSTKE